MKLIPLREVFIDRIEGDYPFVVEALRQQVSRQLMVEKSVDRLVASVIMAQRLGLNWSELSILREAFRNEINIS